MLMLLLHSMMPPSRADIVDVIDYQQQAIKNLLPKGDVSHFEGKNKIQAKVSYICTYAYRKQL